MDDTIQEEKLSKEGERVKEILASILGAEAEDINLNDSLTDDLSMKPTEIAEFLNTLKEKGLELGDTDIEDIVFVSDLIEAVESNTLSEV